MLDNTTDFSIGHWPKSSAYTKIIENDKAKSLWDVQIQTDTLVMANLLDTVVVSKQQKKAVVIDVASPSDSWCTPGRRNLRSIIKKYAKAERGAGEDVESKGDLR